jgi:enolase
MKIEQIRATEIFDARGEPTIECALILEDGSFVTATVPSGRSKSSFEAFDLRDQGVRHLGLGVHKAIENIHEIIAPALIGQLPSVVELDLQMIELDGTENKSRLGANAILAVSIAVLRAQALVEELEDYELIAHLCGYERVSLPFGMFNIINGGVHAQNTLPIQEHMIMPIGADSFRASVEIAARVFAKVRELLIKKNMFFGIGDEGGFSAQFKDERAALDLLMQALDELKLQEQVVFSLDVAATQLYNAEKERYRFGAETYTTQELIDHYNELSKIYPLYSIEDGLNETDWQGWQQMSEQLGEHLQIVGDDIFATNPSRISYGIEHGVADAAIIKPNQIGTVTETLQAVKLCKDYDINPIISHRSGETNDTFIVDLAVGTSAGQIKSGGLMRGERVAKYNRMLSIEEDLMDGMLDF